MSGESVLPMEAEISSTNSEYRAWSVPLRVPKLTTVRDTVRPPYSWGSILRTYAEGFVITGRDECEGPKSVAKIERVETLHNLNRRLSKEEWLLDTPKLKLYWIILQQTDGTYVRAELDESNDQDGSWLILDDRAGHPYRNSKGVVEGWLGNWPLRFVHNLSSGYQYKEICQLIDNVNTRLPDSQKIRIDYEGCTLAPNLVNHKILPWAI